jgi:hypothetical protein
LGYHTANQPREEALMSIKALYLTCHACYSP